MSRIQSHRDLIVWQKSMNLAVAIYELTNHFPSQEQYRLTAQLTRAVISVPANIAEGHARASTKEFAHFLSISRGSLMEVETFVMLAARLGYVADQPYREALLLITEISKMLTVLRSKLMQS